MIFLPLAALSISIRKLERAAVVSSLRLFFEVRQTITVMQDNHTPAVGTD